MHENSDYSLWSPLACIYQQYFHLLLCCLVLSFWSAWISCFAPPKHKAEGQWGTAEAHKSPVSGLQIFKGKTRTYCRGKPDFVPLCGSDTHAHSDKATSRYLQNELLHQVKELAQHVFTSVLSFSYPWTILSLHCIFPFVHSLASFFYCVRTEVWVIHLSFFHSRSQLFLLTCFSSLSAFPLAPNLLFSSISYLPKTDLNKSTGK